MTFLVKMTGEAPEVRSDKKKLFEPYLSNNQQRTLLEDTLMKISFWKAQSSLPS